ncbi:hypothetical protein EBO34_15040 [Alteribacter keqinensis]|uniref:Transposase zinc-ribbon domain-containing protein n=1 Tax=Alteribacter keqinensis TaxID=2483800 RepID=A0A3M7TR04_9BACI|nr:hypothetical protein EBO34_15040 [Alteribacter keqinensis]
MTNYSEMNLITFQKVFATEDACHDQLFQFKWSDGYVCEKCGHKECFVTKTIKHRLYQSTVTVGTVMEKTRTDQMVPSHLPDCL